MTHVQLSSESLPFVLYLRLAEKVVKCFVADWHWGVRYIRIEIFVILNLREATLVGRFEIFSRLPIFDRQRKIVDFILSLSISLI